jgi:hypothetical protein
MSVEEPQEWRAADWSCGGRALCGWSAIMMQHNCGFWDAVGRTAP